MHKALRLIEEPVGRGGMERRRKILVIVGHLQLVEKCCCYNSKQSSRICLTMQQSARLAAGKLPLPLFH